MSVIYRHPLGAFLHHRQCLPSTQDTELDAAAQGNLVMEMKTKQSLYRWKEDLFTVFSPFIMDSQAERLQRESAEISSGKDVKETSAQRKRRKKAGKELKLSESEKKISSLIGQALPPLTEQALKLGYLEVSQQASASAHQDNNMAGRLAAQAMGCGDLFQDACQTSDQDNFVVTRTDYNTSVHLDGGESVLKFRTADVVGRYVCNKENKEKIIEVGGHQFIIPPLSSFLMSNFHQFVTRGYQQITSPVGYDLIVIDPPWINKSVKRKKCYQMVREEDLARIPVPELAAMGCLVGVWVTNNERLKNFVRAELFPGWAVDFVAEWIWMKVTKQGEPVSDINSTHKKPYEQLIIGRYRHMSTSQHPVTTSLDCCDTTSDNKLSSISRGSSEASQKSTQNWEQEAATLPADFVFTSIPCCLHSKKPCLGDLLSPYLPESPTCLELFARNLNPGWVSWGNEPLVHQHIDFFEQVLDR